MHQEISSGAENTGENSQPSKGRSHSWGAQQEEMLALAWGQDEADSQELLIELQPPHPLLRTTETY